MRILKYNKFKLEWSLEDVSGNCSPSGSTTIDSGEILFNDISEKDDMIEKIVDESRFENSIKCKLYITLYMKKDDDWSYVEDIDV